MDREDLKSLTETAKQEKVRKFETGATRDAGMVNGVPKLSYRGFFCPMVLKRRAEYMNKHRLQSDGTLRDPDNWKKGMPREVYVESLMRHVHDVWSLHEACPVEEGVTLEESICAAMFNLEGMLHEILKDKTALRELNPTTGELRFVENPRTKQVEKVFVPDIAP